MSFQTIIDNATYLTIDKRKVTAFSVSRSGHVKTAERNPSTYTLTVGTHDGLKYSTNRGVLEDIDTSDRIIESNISLANNTGMTYITNYQGNLSVSQQAQIDVNGASGNDLYIDFSNITGATTDYTVFLKKGDYIQPKGNTSTYRYPYQVTEDVAYTSGANSNITVNVHRPVLSQTGVSLTGGHGVRLGSDVRFHVKALQCPTYNVIPYDRISFNGDFVFQEIIT